jgi:GxxExxY protein
MARPEDDMKIDLIYKDEAYTLVGAAMEVHRVLGCGFLEPVYQEAMEIELSLRGIPFVPQKELPVRYKEQLLKKRYIVDFLAYDKIIVEIKALE